MNYINDKKKRLVGRNNQTIYNPIVMDYSTVEDLSFQIINDQNQIQELGTPSGLYIAGSLGIGKPSYDLLFLSKNYTITSGNILTFSVDTYTITYLNSIKKKNTEINIEIGQEINDTKRTILRDYALACPRVYVSGLSPQQIDSKNYYTKSEVDEKISGLILTENDPIYTADKPTIALKTEIPTKVSQLQNDSGFISGYTESDPIYSAEKSTLALKSELFSKDYNDLTNKPTIPSKTSDLTNDSGFISGYIETDPIYTADKPTIALKSELFSGSYNDLTDKPENITTQGNTFNTANKLVQLDSNGKIPSALYDKGSSTGDYLPLSGGTITGNVVVNDQLSGFELRCDKFNAGDITLNDVGLNEANSLVQLDSNGKIPTYLYDVQVTNKEAMFVDSTAKTGTFNLVYDKDYKVFVNTYTPSNSTLDIGLVTYATETLAANETATFENWIKISDSSNISTITLNENITVVGDLPTSLTGTLIHVFVRRIYMDSNNTIHESISYAYSF